MGVTSTRERVTRHTSFAFSILVLLFALGSNQALASEEVVRYEFRAEESDAQLEDIMYLSVGVQLAKAGFTSSRSAEKAPYILVVSYVSRVTEADISLSLFDSENRQRPLSEIAVLLAIDFSLDARIEDAVGTLLRDAGFGDEDARKPTRQSGIEGLFSKTVGQGTGGEMSPDEILAATALRLRLAIGIGAQVFLGEISEFTPYGLTGTLSAAALKPWRSWSLAVGFRATATRAFNASGVSGGPLLISALGADIAIGTGYTRPYRMAIAATGGAATISILGEEERMHKIVPYAGVGLGVHMPIGAGFTAGLDLRYLLVFDQDVLIMAAEPVFSIGKEF